MANAHPIVLIVDDDADMLAMYQVGLTADGFHAVTTRDVSSVALQVETVRPDAIVIDLQLFGASGESIVEMLNRPLDQTIPVILLTSRTDSLVCRRAQELGCAAIVTKPCLPDSLATILRRVLHAHSRRDESDRPSQGPGLHSLRATDVVR